MLTQSALLFENGLLPTLPIQRDWEAELDDEVERDQECSAPRVDVEALLLRNHRKI